MKKERGTHRGWPIDGENCDRQSARALSPRDEREVTYIRAFHRGRFSETAHFSFQPVRPTWLLPFSSRFHESKSDRLSNDAHLEKEARKKGIRNRVIMYVQGDSEICIDIYLLKDVNNLFLFLLSSLFKNK